MWSILFGIGWNGGLMCSNLFCVILVLIQHSLSIKWRYLWTHGIGDLVLAALVIIQLCIVLCSVHLWVNPILLKPECFESQTCFISLHPRYWQDIFRNLLNGVSIHHIIFYGLQDLFMLDFRRCFIYFRRCLFYYSGFH